MKGPVFPAGGKAHYNTRKWWNNAWIWLIITNLRYWSCQCNHCCHLGQAWLWWLLQIMQHTHTLLQTLSLPKIALEIKTQHTTQMSKGRLNWFTHQKWRYRSLILMRLERILVERMMLLMMSPSPHHAALTKLSLTKSLCSTKKWWLRPATLAEEILLTIVHSSQVLNIILILSQWNWSER